MFLSPCNKNAGNDGLCQAGPWFDGLFSQGGIERGLRKGKRRCRDAFSVRSASKQPAVAYVGLVMLGQRDVAERNDLDLPDGAVVDYCGGREHIVIFIVTIAVTTLPSSFSGKNGGRGWIRTNVGVRQRIYSPPPLATRAPFRVGKGG